MLPLLLLDLSSLLGFSFSDDEDEKSELLLRLLIKPSGEMIFLFSSFGGGAEGVVDDFFRRTNAVALTLVNPIGFFFLPSSVASGSFVSEVK